MNKLLANVQVCYTFLHGPVIRIDGKTQPTTLDEIEQQYGQSAVDAMMENAGHYVTVSEELACAQEAARQAREHADAAVAEAERITSARLAAGNVAAVDAVTALFAWRTV